MTVCLFVACVPGAVPLTVSWSSSRGGVRFHHAVYSLGVKLGRGLLFVCAYVCVHCRAHVSRLWCNVHRDVTSPCRGNSTSPSLCYLLCLFAQPKALLLWSWSTVSTSEENSCLSFPALVLFVCLFVPKPFSLSPPATYCDIDCQRQMTWGWHVYVFMCLYAPGVGSSGSNLMLLILPNEHNLEAWLSSYICGRGGVLPEWKRREKLCRSFILRALSQPNCSAFSVPLVFHCMEETES